MKKQILILGICATLCSQVQDWAIRVNLVQVVKKEEWDPQTKRWEVKELWSERHNPDKPEDEGVPNEKPSNPFSAFNRMFNYFHSSN